MLLHTLYIAVYIGKKTVRACGDTLYKYDKRNLIYIFEGMRRKKKNCYPINMFVTWLFFHALCQAYKTYVCWVSGLNDRLNHKRARIYIICIHYLYSSELIQLILILDSVNIWLWVYPGICHAIREHDCQQKQGWQSRVLFLILFRKILFFFGKILAIVPFEEVIMKGHAEQPDLYTLLTFFLLLDFFFFFFFI